MRVLPVIDDPRVVEKILRHLGAWRKLAFASSCRPMANRRTDETAGLLEHSNPAIAIATETGAIVAAN